MTAVAPIVAAVPSVAARQVRMLRTAMGAVIAAALEDRDVVEVLLNPDGSLWVDTLSQGRKPTGLSLSAPDAERIIRLVAAHVRVEVHSGSPIVSAELPESGERFEGLIPPVVPAPTFAIRKRASLVFTLDRYVDDRILTAAQAALLRQAVRDRLNIVIAGGTSTGKTTLANALLDEVARTGDRVLILEDTRELQCLADDQVALRTKPGVASMAELVRSTLRLRPDRIVVGEVRGPEALDLLKAWCTGHPGRNRDRPRRLCRRCAQPSRAAHPGSGRHRPAAAHRRGGRRRRVHRRPWQQSARPRDRARHRARAGRLPARDLHRNRRSPPRRSTMTLARIYGKARTRIVGTAALLFCNLLAAPAYAAGSQMPWEAPLQKVLDSVEGPVAKILAVIIIITTGLTLAFGDTSGGFRKLIQIIFGLSIAFAASSFFLSFFSFGGGALVA